ncbi:MAG: DEAD/DEAH box helicase, partial [Mariprofundales bacterium]
ATVAWQPRPDLSAFALQLQQWQRPIDLLRNSPFQFSFRLSEPDAETDAEAEAEADSEEDEAAWRVDYLLQPKDDPSLRIPLSEYWQHSGKKTDAPKWFNGKTTETILTVLGQAAGISPQVAASLKTVNPDGFTLDAASACHFLQQQAEALRDAGFSVILPSWLVGRGTAQKVALKASAKSPSMQAAGGLTLDSLVAFDLKASLGDQTVDLDELKQLANMKSELVRVRGQWTIIDHDAIQRAVQFLQKQQQGHASARDVITMALGSEQQLGGMKLTEMETDGWLHDLLATLTGKQEFALKDQPQQFIGALRPYQLRGFSWLALMRQWGLGACLADDMGLGKTVQALSLLQHEREAGESRPVLLICPTSVINNWYKEAERFTPALTVLIHHGPDRRRKAAFAQAAAQHALVISSYGLMQRDIDFIQQIDWAGVVLDEAQNIKNPESKQSKAARSIQAEYRIALTGTPVENHVGDLWALMDFLNPGLLGKQNAFKTSFFRPIQVWRNAEVAARLKSLTSPFILRRMKTDRSIISDLPDKIEQKAYCTLTKEQASLYQSVVDNLQQSLQSAEGIARRGLVLATLSKLKQVCNHPAQFLGDSSSLAHRSGKLERLQEMVEEIREVGERVLIFTQFSQMGGLMQSYLQEELAEEVLFLHGGTARKQRDAMVERFQNDPDAPSIFILSLKAGGTGLTLTRANHVIHFDRWWNPAVENQATDRAFRIGQKHTVQVHKFMVAGTLEERIDAMITQKSNVASQVVGSGEQWLTELSNDDLCDLITL